MERSAPGPEVSCPTLDTPPHPRLRFLTAVLFLGLAAVITRLAWLSDDAYITLRCVENWCAGHGLVWNASERVQAYTHPLWMLLLAFGRWLSGETFFTTLGLSITLSLLAALTLVRSAGTVPAGAAVLVVLICSRSFTEFATSGLENPLVFLLLASFPAIYAGNATGKRRMFAIALLTGLAATTRLDLALLCGPALLAACRGVRVVSALALVVLGLLPFLAWLAFATLYYGSPFPITAYAKAIALGMPAGELIQQGLHYLWYVINQDPLTMTVLALGTAVGLFDRRLKSRALALGVLCYCAYVVKVGGDFMGGRFMTPQFVIATAILGRWLATLPATWSAATAVLATGLLLVPGIPAWCHRPAHDLVQPPSSPWSLYHGIIDERRAYYGAQGLLSPERSLPAAGALSTTLRQHRTRPIVVLWAKVGRYGFEVGDLVHIVDSWLLDPLLMRLPMQKDPNWRIGHFTRRVPEGYLETIATGDNRLHHAGLRRYYEALRTVIRAEVCDGERLRTTLAMLRGDFDADLAAFVAEEYHTPPRLRIDAADLDRAVKAGTWWFDDPRCRCVYTGGIEVTFPAEVTARSLRLLVQGEMSYTLRFRRAGRELASAVADVRHLSFLGLQEVRVTVPAEAATFDSVWVDAAMDWDSVAAIAVLVPEP